MKCSKCNHKFKVTAEQRGQSISCPKCGQSLKILPKKKPTVPVSKGVAPPPAAPVAQPAAPPPVAPPPPAVPVAPPPVESADPFDFPAEPPVPPISGEQRQQPVVPEADIAERENAPLPDSWRRAIQGLILVCIAIGTLTFGLLTAVAAAFAQESANEGIRTIFPSLATATGGGGTSRAGGIAIITVLISGAIGVAGLIRCSAIPEKTGGSGLAISSAVGTGVAMATLLLSLLIFAFSEGRYLVLGILEIITHSGFAAAVLLFVFFLTQTALALQHRILGAIASSLLLFVVLIPIALNGIDKLLTLTVANRGTTKDIQTAGQTVQVIVIIALVVTAIWTIWLTRRIVKEIPIAYRRGKV